MFKILCKIIGHFWVIYEWEKGYGDKTNKQLATKLICSRCEKIYDLEKRQKNVNGKIR